MNEETLLKEIPNALGWEWHGEERFDSISFIKSVGMVIVSDVGVDITGPDNSIIKNKDKPCNS